MRILLITQYFFPENFKSNDIAFELAKRGYSVDVLAGIPNYPEGKYFKGYGVFRRRKEKIRGVNVYRTYQIPRGKGGWRLGLNYLSYVVSACADILFCFAWKKYDRIIVHEPSPIFQAVPAILLKRLRRIPVYLWVLDIWPDAMRSGGGVKSAFLLNSVDRVVKWVYRNCDKLLISSKRFSESILPKGDFESKLIYFPNWSDDMQKGSDVKIPELPDGFIIMMAGNLGHSQNLDAVMKLIEELKDSTEIKWVFVGGGSEKGRLDNYIVEHRLSESVFAFGRYPAEAMPSFYARADALLLTLRSGFPHLAMVVPSRLQSYMSAGRPVLAMIGRGGADVINESDCGYAVPAGDYESLAAIIRKDVLTDKVAFEKKGSHGRRYYERYFEMNACIDHLCDIIR